MKLFKRKKICDSCLNKISGLKVICRPCNKKLCLEGECLRNHTEKNHPEKIFTGEIMEFDDFAELPKFELCG